MIRVRNPDTKQQSVGVAVYWSGTVGEAVIQALDRGEQKPEAARTGASHDEGVLMADANEQLVRDGYDAFSSGDMEKLGKLFKDDAVHSVPGDNQITGDYKGVDNVLAFYGKLFEITGGNMAVELKSVTVKGDHVDALHHATAAIGDKKLEGDTTLAFTIEDGKIARIDEKPHDQAAEDAFWGK